MARSVRSKCASWPKNGITAQHGVAFVLGYGPKPSTKPGRYSQANTFRCHDGFLVQSRTSPQSGLVAGRSVSTRATRVCAIGQDCRWTNEPIVHAMAKLLKKLGVKHTMKDGSRFTADRGVRIHVLNAGELQKATIFDYRHRGLLTYSS